MVMDWVTGRPKNGEVRKRATAFAARRFSTPDMFAVEGAAPGLARWPPGLHVQQTVQTLREYQQSWLRHERFVPDRMAGCLARGGKPFLCQVFIAIYLSVGYCLS